MPDRRYVPKPEEIPSGLCECGCGRSTSIVQTATYSKKRQFRGHPYPFIRGHHKQQRGRDHHHFKGRRTLGGYVHVYMPEHPNARKAGWTKGFVLEHRIVMEQTIGRLLTAIESVHHINGNTLDNRPENLQLRAQKHGAGVAFRCADCGSCNVVPVPLE